MSEKTEKYCSLLVAAINAQNENNDTLEESLMSELDSLWLSMSATELTEVQLFSKTLSNRWNNINSK